MVILDKVKNPFMRKQLEEAFTKYMSNTPINGNVYYVHDSGSSASSGENIESPISTIDSAYNQTIVDNGDVIFVLPNHAETLTAASAIDFDKKGVRIIGVGSGEDRPKITFGTDVGASIEFAADGITFVNFICIAGIDALTGPLWVKSEGNVIDVETRDGSSTVEAERWLLSTADGDKNVVNAKHIGFPAGDAGVNWARIVGGNDWDIKIDYYGIASTGIIEFHTTACTNVKVKGNTYNSTTTDYSKTVVDTVGTSTWSYVGFDGETGQFCSGCQDSAISAEDVSAVIDALYGTTGIATFPSAAAPANNVSLAEVIRDIWDVLRNGTGGTEPGTNRSIIDDIQEFGGEGKKVTKTITYDGSVSYNAFTVTGEVAVKVIGVVTTALTNHADTTSVGTATSAAGLIAATAGTAMQTVDQIWTDNAPSKFESFPSAHSLLNETIAVVGTANLAGGVVQLYAFWKPISSDGNLVAAT